MSEDSERKHETGAHEEQQQDPALTQVVNQQAVEQQQDREENASDNGVSGVEGNLLSGNAAHDLDAAQLRNLNNEVVHAFESVPDSNNGSNDSSIPQVNLTTDQENVVPLAQQSEDEESHHGDNQDESQAERRDVDMADANTSELQPPAASSQQFATPLKSLPPLKDIEPIVTPKSFSVAKDADVDTSAVTSSPLVYSKKPQADNLVQNDDHDESNDDTFARSSYT